MPHQTPTRTWIHRNIRKTNTINTGRMNSVHSRLRSGTIVCVCSRFLWQRLPQKACWKKNISFWLCCKIHFSSAVYYVSVKTNLRNLVLEVWLLFQMKQWKDSVCNCHGILKVLIQLWLPEVFHTQRQENDTFYTFILHSDPTTGFIS